MNLNDISLDWWIKDTMERVPEAQREACKQAMGNLPYFVNSATGSNKDDRGNTIPFGTGPHSYRAFEIWSKVIPEPVRILEIGFNLGHGAAALLALFPRSDVFSVDIRDSSELHNARKILNERYPTRHELWIGDSKSPKMMVALGGSFQAAFIDGAHDLLSIISDIEVCRRLGVRDFLLDDVHPRHGDTLAAIKATGLKLHAIVGANMAICEDV
jgi:hypothetical protein